MEWGWIFLDAGEALFTPDSFTGLQRMFLDYGVTFTAEDFQDYQAINKSPQVNCQNSAITSLQLQHGRFESWVERLSIEPGKLNEAFINAIAETCTPLPSAASLLNAVHGNAKIGIITNGLSALQQMRLEHMGLRNYFDLLMISGEVGVAKPNRKIFGYVLEQAGSPDRSRVLMVGDTAESGILGGISTGLATCWLNAHHREQPEDIAPIWTVSSLHELEQFLCKYWLPPPR